MADKLTKSQKKPTQVDYERKETVTAPPGYGEGGIYVPKGSGG